MILLLDASKIRIWDWDNDKLIFPQSENDFQAGYAEEINTLRDQYDFNQIKKIILIDTNPEPILSSVFRTEGYEGEYFESLFQEQSGYFYSLFRNTKVFNNSNLGLTKSSDEKSYIFNFTDINSLNLKHLKSLIGDDKIIFFSNYLTPITIKILQHFKNIEGYYKPSISELKYEKILYTDEFLNLIFDLQTLKRIDYSTYKNKMAFSNINGVLPDYGNWTHIPQSLLNLKYLDQEKIKKILIVGSEKYFIRGVVSIIWGDKKNIITFPSSSKIGISQECDGIIIKDIDALLNEDATLTDDFTQLLLKLSQTELKEKIVVLHSTKSIPGIDLPGFTRILLPDKNGNENYYPDYFYYMLKQKQLFTENSTSHQHNAAMWLVNSRSKIISSYLKKIPSLDDMDLLLDEIKIDIKLSVDFNYQDFWYEFLLFHIDSYLNRYKPIEHITDYETIPETIHPSYENDSKYITNSPLYVFSKRKNDKIKIIFNGREVALPNEGLMGLHHLRYILKYGEAGVSYEDIDISENNNKDTYSLNESFDEEEKEFLSPEAKMESIDYMDPKTVKAIKIKIENLSKERISAKSESNIDRVEEIDKELKKIKEYRDKNLKLNGKSRKAPTKAQNIKKRVKKNIKEALNQIKLADIDLYLFLKKSIIIDRNTDKYKYIKDPTIDWILD